MITKQTAVEWLYDTMITFPKTMDDLSHNASSFKIAKQMEKEQIINAYANGVVNEISIYNTITGEQYYNETYNINK